MRNPFMLLPAVGLLLACGGGAERPADRETGAMGEGVGTDTMATPMADAAGDAGLNWQPAPEALPSGARVAVISGDPAEAGPFTVQLDMPPDYAVRPHTHPAAEQLRLIEGTLHLGHGAKWDPKAFETVELDQTVTIEAKKPHFIHTASRVILEVQGTGPFAINYVDQKDDPRTATP